ncbi:carbohydrate-binding module family 13 [Trichoderma cornu-damae]|uniref:Carbohydrate-binding module family 13 n=1 Tax=Trichoderma cornu-damae TaxID=654480 RepID=A0A9P8QK71_9HYPO|nr:carbohydrate-binding module family 13 [Trichoderma cornu-damae]
MTLKDGIFIIASMLPTNPVLDIYGASNPFNGAIAGVVGLSVLSNTILIKNILKSVLSNVWITAPRDGSVSQVDTSKYDPIYNEDTRWKITNVDSSTYQIESVKFPSHVIDLEYASSADNTHAILYPNQNSVNQIWKFIPVAI